MDAAASWDFVEVPGGLTSWHWGGWNQMVQTRGHPAGPCLEEKTQSTIAVKTQFIPSGEEASTLNVLLSVGLFLTI